MFGVVALRQRLGLTTTPRRDTTEAMDTPVSPSREMLCRGVIVVERAGIDSGRRVVHGEAMLAAPPEVVDGGTVREVDLAGSVHFDGMFLDPESVRKLADRFATKSCGFDVEHNNTPIAAVAVESLVARDGWAPWTPGAWVVGVHVPRGTTWIDDEGDEPRDVWDDIESGRLAGFSIQFMVRVQPISLTVIDADDVEHDRVLLRASDPDPHFLSLVAYPATGAHFRLIDRTVPEFRALPVADADTAWNPAAARARVRIWAGGDDIDFTRYAAAFAYINEAEPALLGSYELQIADVVDEDLVVVPKAVEAAMNHLDTVPDAERDAARRHLEKYMANTAEPVAEAKIEPVTEPVEATKAVEPVVVEPVEPVEATKAVEPVTEPEPVVVKTSFDTVMAAVEVQDQLWQGWHALMIALGDAEDTDAVRGNIEQFAAWLIGQAADIGGFRSAVATELDVSRVADPAVERAGRKMSKQRFDRLVGAVDTLVTLRDELREAAIEDDDDPAEGKAKSVDVTDARVDAALAAAAAVETRCAALEAENQLLRNAPQRSNKLRDAILDVAPPALPTTAEAMSRCLFGTPH